MGASHKGGDELPLQDIELMGYPLVVKPNTGGSSVGVQIVHDRSALLAAVTEVLNWDSEIIIEQYLIGDEITCPILNEQLLPVLSIKHTAVFFDYQAKYDDASTVEEPVELPPLAIHDRVAKAAMISYKSLKCSVYARVDMLIKDGVPYVLEVNTLPGMTQNSLLPKSALAAGISYSALLDSIIESSLQIDRNK